MRPLMIGGLLAATLSSAACYAMKPVTLEELGRLRPTQVRGTRGDQSVVVFFNPQVFGSKLVGFVDGKYREVQASDMTRLRMRTPAHGRTAALIVGTTLGIATFAYLVTSSGSYVDPCSMVSGSQPYCQP